MEKDEVSNNLFIEVRVLLGKFFRSFLGRDGSYSENLHFEKPIISVCLSHPFSVILFVFHAAVASSMYIIGPVLLAYILREPNIVNIFQLLMSLILALTMLAIFKHFHPVIIARLPRYMLLKAHEHILKCDPSFHSTGDREDITIAINDMHDAYKKIVDNIYMNMIPMILSSTLLIILFSLISSILGITLFCILVILSIISFLLYRSSSHLNKPYIQELKLQTRQLNLEIIHQAPLIRSTFATADYIKLLYSYNLQSANADALQIRMNTLTWSFIQCFGVIGIGILLYMSILIGIDDVTIIALLSSYIYVMQQGAIIGKTILKTIRSRNEILINAQLILNYGDQTYRVMKSE